MAGVEIRNQAIGLSLENSASDLSPTSTGLVYFNTTSSIAKVYTGASWKTFLYADLSNVTGTLAIANGGTGQTTQTAAFDALAPTTTTGDTIYHNGTDNVRLPVGANGQVLGVTSGLPAWQDAASGGSGVNYIDNDDFESVITGWSTYADAAAATPVDGTGGSPTSTFTRNTATPLRGNADGKFSKDAANRQGEGFSVVGAVPSGYTFGQKSQIRFLWDGSHANYVAGDMVVYIYDVTNSTLITPTATSLPKAKRAISIAFDQSGTGASYRLIFHVATTNASAYDIFVDDVLVGPDFPGQGAVVGEWQSYTPTWSNVTIGGSSTAYGTWRRVGSNMEIRAGFILGGSDDVTGVIELSIPAGYTIDTSKLNTSIQYNSVGVVEGLDGAIFSGGIAVWAPALTGIRFLAGGAGGNYWNATAPTNWSAGNSSLSTWITVPIAEWAGSGTFVGQNNVEYAASTSGTWDAAAAAAGTIYGPSGAPITGALTSARSKIVRCQTAIQATDSLSVQLSEDGVVWYDADGFKNAAGSNYVTNSWSSGAGLSASAGVYLSRVSGSSTDVEVQFLIYTYIANDDSPVGNWENGWRWRLVKSAAGQAVGFGLATSTSAGLVKAPIACAAYASAGPTGLTSGALTKLQLNVEELDSHSFFDNVTNFRATPNVPGWYQVSWSMRAATTTANSGRNLGTSLYKNGSGFKDGIQLNHTSTGHFDSGISNGSALVYANGVTDYFEVFGFLVTASGTWYMIGGQSTTFFSMVKVSD